jgi:hypothetical protein
MCGRHLLLAFLFLCCFASLLAPWMRLTCLRTIETRNEHKPSDGSADADYFTTMVPIMY